LSNVWETPVQFVVSASYDFLDNGIHVNQQVSEPEAVRRRYANPPVVEALVEFFFNGSHWAPTTPGLFYSEVKSDFPAESALDQFELDVTVTSAQAGARVSRGEQRSRFLSADELQMVQVARNLLVFNQMRPSHEVTYPHFEDWRPVVMRMLDTYRAAARPAAIERLGMRYINRVVIPHTGFRMEEYFRLYPEIPATLGGTHHDFLMRVAIPPLHPDHQLIVTFGSAPTEEPGTTAHLLDLYDILHLQETESFEAVQQRLDEAHGNIVQAFECSITDRARELFGEVTTDGNHSERA
jgi:uncharacterized protein (TIGR04255 family)